MSIVAETFSSPTPSPSPSPAPAPAPAPSPAPTPSPEPSPAPAPSWRDQLLSDETLRTSEHLARYGSVEDLAKAHIQTTQWARGRVAVPGAEDAEGFAEFVGKVRPEKADDYKILGPDGKPSETGELFRPILHKAGLHPLQASELVAGWNQLQADLTSQRQQAAKDQITAVELELGASAYNQRLAAVEKMFDSLGVPIKNVADAMEQLTDAGTTMRALFTLAEKTGELAKVDSTEAALRGGRLSAEQAQAEINAQNSSSDPELIKKLGDPNSSEAKRRKELFAVIAKARAGS